MTVIDFNKWRGDTPHPEIDYPALTAHALSQARSILEVWLPGGILKGREWVCANTKGGNGTSCSTNILTGAGSDFASGETWGDLVDMVSKVERIPMHEAATKVAKHIGADLTKPLPPLPPVVTPSPEEKYIAGRENALRLIEQSVECPTTHEYLVRKNIKAAPGVVLHKQTGNLLVPLYDERGAFWSVQRISPDGTKKINDGGKLSGNFYLFMGRTDAVYLAEGYATAATVHELTGATTIMGISSGNMPAVAEVIARLYPTATLICAGDADEPGRKCSTKAIERAPRFRAIFPPVEGQDWNDYGVANPALAQRMLTAFIKTPMLIDINHIEMSEPDYLIDGAIETPCTGMVFGTSGSGKSFFVLDLSLHCAAGVPWLGKTVKEGPAIYLCGEGRHAIPRRVAAWKKIHGAIPDGRFMMSQRRVQFDASSIKEMVSEINEFASKDTPPVLIVIDTMARSLPGDADENSSRDVMAFVDACDYLQRQYNCVVMVVHHTGHAEDARRRARGSSALKGAMDFEILLDNEKGVIEWTKTKDSEPHLPIKYELVKTAYGDGPNGNSCIVKYDVKYDPTTENMTKPAKVGAQTLATLCHKLGTTQVPEDTWREEFYVSYEGAPKGKRMAFNRAKNDLERIRYIEIRGETICVRSENLQGDSVEQAMFGHLLSNNKTGGRSGL